MAPNGRKIGRARDRIPIDHGACPASEFAGASHVQRLRPQEIVVAFIELQKFQNPSDFVRSPTKQVFIADQEYIFSVRTARNG
jgi:hypothetical protein